MLLAHLTRPVPLRPVQREEDRVEELTDVPGPARFLKSRDRLGREWQRRRAIARGVDDQRLGESGDVFPAPAQAGSRARRRPQPGWAPRSWWRSAGDEGPPGTSPLRPQRPDPSSLRR